MSFRPRPNTSDDRGISVLIIVLVGYATALIVVPPGLGIEFASVVISPARALLVVLLALVGWHVHRRGLSVAPALAPWLGFLAAMGISTAIHPSGASLARWLSLVLEGAGVWFAVLVTCEVSRHRVFLRNGLIVSTTAVAATAALLSIFHLQFDDPIRSFLGLPADTFFRERFGRMRIEGSFGQPLLFATWLLPASALLLPMLSRETAAKFRVAYAAAWLLIAVAVFLTGSRVALVLVLALPAAYFFIRKSRIAAAIAGVLAVVAAVVMLEATFEIPPAPTSSETARPAASAVETPLPSREPETEALAASGEMRVEAYIAGARAVAQRPAFGWGLLTGSEVLENITGTRSYVDNSYLQLAIEAGLAGLGMFAWLAWTVLVLASRARSSEEGLAAYLGLITFFGMGVLASFVAVTQLYAALWLYAALAASTVCRFSVTRSSPPASGQLDRAGVHERF